MSGNRDTVAVSSSSNSNSVYTNTIHIQHKRDLPVSLRLNSAEWQKFKSRSKALGYSANFLINSLVEAFNSGTNGLEPNAPVINMNMAIAKAEATTTVNVRNMALNERLDTILAKVPKLKSLIVKQPGNTMNYETAKMLRDDILKVLEKARTLTPEKLEEVNAGLVVLKGMIAEGRREYER